MSDELVEAFKHIESIDDLVSRANHGLPELGEKWAELEAEYKSQRKRATRTSMLRLAVILGSDRKQRDKMLSGRSTASSVVFGPSGKKSTS